MKHRSFVLLVLTLVLLVVGSVAVYAYDSSRDDRIAEGITVAGVDVGGMTTEEAREAVRDELGGSLKRPVRVRHGDERFVLSAKEARLRTDLDGMVDEAIDRSRDGSMIGRVYRNLTGGRVDEDVPLRLDYSERAVRKLVKEVETTVNRPPQDASVRPAGDGLQKIPSRSGFEVRAGKLKRDVIAALENPFARHSIRASGTKVKPKVTTEQVAKKYPYYITIDRGAYKLRFFKRLKLVNTYDIAVGQVGFDTPAGLYHVQNKAVNPAWNVPNKAWAGDKAGQVIPGGTAENPLKARWMGIYDGAGIHGTDQEGSIGSSASHGCIRMRIPEVIELYDQVPVQTPVYIS
jgi:lipoprotein-anchoring transpeptidase ErfK/SrfK